MPLRSCHLRAVLVGRSEPFFISRPCRYRREFHSSQPLRDDNTPKNHYETLNVHHSASPAEIKKSFYTLSKKHHPDHNPSDPHASHRFMRISEAYGVLGHPDVRARYDRDVLHLSSPSPSSTGPAGGRAASGLSRRRRGTFTGPPPSFFRAGGWGAHSAKRRAAHEESTGAGAGGGGGGDRRRKGGMGPGQDPFGHRDEEVPHFDGDAHEQTQWRTEEERRARRVARGQHVVRDHVPDMGTAASFLVISGVLLTGLLVPLVAIAVWSSPPGKADGRVRRRPDDRI